MTSRQGRKVLSCVCLHVLQHQDDEEANPVGHSLLFINTNRPPSQFAPAMERETTMQGRQEPTGPRRKPILLVCRTFALQWIALNWLDGLFISAIAGISFGIYYAPLPFTRTFPVTFGDSGDIVYPQWAYPYRGWIIPSWLSGFVSIAMPIGVYLLAQVRVRSASDASSAVVGSLWAVVVSTLVQVVTKILIGGFRPYFLDVCMPDLSLAGSANRTGLNGVGFGRVMYTTEICTQTDGPKLRNAMTSFPSGHATVAFAGFGFLFLWLNGKLKVWADHRPAGWKLLLTLLPLFVAFLMACSLTIDAAHNGYDIVAGSAIGSLAALAVYRTSYAAVWDWRYNHIPLRRREPFVYGAGEEEEEEEEEVEGYAGQTLSRSAGWGRQRRRRLPKRQPESTRGSPVYATARNGASEAARAGNARPPARDRHRQALTNDEAV
ncbi:hypothetical protein RJ55_04610 [Drechmeria coniospora]|nr:hypothetical protein RJ55_04610 [Drechmeria coniospora]